MNKSTTKKKTNSKTPAGETACICICFFFECICIQFFNSLTCDLWHAMPRQKSLTLIPREAEDFPRGDNHSKHVPLPTYLALLQPIYYNCRFVFIHVNTLNILLLVKTLIKKQSSSHSNQYPKKYKTAAILIISSHAMNQIIKLN